MTNASKEFIEAVKGRKVKAAHVKRVNWSGVGPEWFLQVGHTEGQFVEFLDKLDFIYDAGFGSQELEGFIWFEDGTWCTRGEYDGSEWWEHQECPAIPDACKTTFDAEAPFKRIN